YNSLAQTNSAPPKPLTWKEGFDVGEPLVTAFIRTHKQNIDFKRIEKTNGHFGYWRGGHRRLLRALSDAFGSASKLD
ncbi:MAG: hypothetical protein NWQ21_03060, partial [Desulfobacterales bacterium]|nr:hypothetical protein [Desulfobacterales bacterium]